MGTNQKYSTRIHSKRQLEAVSNHLSNADKLLTDIGARYAEVLPRVSLGCAEMIKLLNMLSSMVSDIRENI